MGQIEYLYERLGDFIPLLVTLTLVVLLLWGINWALLRRAKLTTESRLPRQLTMVAASIVALICVILALPVNDATRGDLLSLLGLVLTGVIALSSTTFVANAMAGLMLRSVRSFRHGDFIRVGEHFGRVTERGLFHTEIQTEARDLLTLPNLHIASNPVTVVRSSGTIITADLSLGYDVPYYRVQPLLKEAAAEIGLQEPFVQIISLGDFSVVYRVSGYYPEVRHLLTMRSRLKESVLDSLHRAGIEIVSPTFMNQRQVGEQQFLAPAKQVSDSFLDRHPPPESLIFDKADKAEKIHILENECKALLDEIKELVQREKDEKIDLKADIGLREERIKKLENIIRVAKDNSKND